MITLRGIIIALYSDSTTNETKIPPTKSSRTEAKLS